LIKEKETENFILMQLNEKKKDNKKTGRSVCRIAKRKKEKRNKAVGTGRGSTQKVKHNSAKN
jgi:hypothetical protein